MGLSAAVIAVAGCRVRLSWLVEPYGSGEPGLAAAARGAVMGCYRLIPGHFLNPWVLFGCPSVAVWVFVRFSGHNLQLGRYVESQVSEQM